MIWRMLIVTSFVLSTTMMSLCKDVTFEQSFHRHVENHVPAAKLSARETVTKHSRVVSIIKSFAKLSIDNSRTNATFDRVYSDSVKRRDLIIFNFPQSFPQDLAVRLHVSSADANITMPVLFVVKEQQSVLSWQVPLVTDNKVQYHNVSRTLCRINDSTMLRVYPGFTVEVSTLSPIPLYFTLQAELTSFDLFLNKQRHLNITASEPMYLRYTFVNVSTVMVSVTSPDETCLLFSLQEMKCPVADMGTNINRFLGMYQTVGRNGSITVERSHFSGDSFFVVLTVLPSDYTCRQIETINWPAAHGDDRRKSLFVEVTESKSGNGWWIAVFTAVVWFLGIYLLTIFVVCIYRTCDKQPLHTSSQCEDDETQRIRSGIGTSYGSVSGQPVEIVSVTEAQDDEDNRAPSPPGSIVDSDTSLMSDADDDKNIVRTKTSLYVLDLARKPHKVLMKKYRLYYLNLIPISVFYILPVVQLMFNYTKLLSMTGDQDLCYYNFKCVNPVGILYAFNNVFSNIGYVMLGLLFLMIVRRRDLRRRTWMEKTVHIKQHRDIPQQFGLYYAMGIALVMEGVLSSCYHVCPNKANFQFDTAFMYVMACLLMLCLYQKRHPDISPHAHTAYTAMSLVIFIQVIGVTYISTPLLIVFTVIHLVCILLLSIQIYYMGRWRLDLGMFARVYRLLKVDRHRCAVPMYMDRIYLLLIGIIVNVSVDAYSLWRPPPFANYLLLIFMVNLTLYFIFYITMKIRSHERILCVPAFYIVMATILWALAFYFYLWHATSWHETPARSREFNSRCILFDFYDSHDIWHFLSSMSLFFSLMTMLTLDDDLLEVPRSTIHVF